MFELFPLYVSPESFPETCSTDAPRPAESPCTDHPHSAAEFDDYDNTFTLFVRSRASLGSQVHSWLVRN